MASADIFPGGVWLPGCYSGAGLLRGRTGNPKSPGLGTKRRSQTGQRRLPSLTFGRLTSQPKSITRSQWRIYGPTQFISRVANRKATEVLDEGGEVSEQAGGFLLHLVGLFPFVIAHAGGNVVGLEEKGLGIT